LNRTSRIIICPHPVNAKECAGAFKPGRRVPLNRAQPFLGVGGVWRNRTPERNESPHRAVDRVGVRFNVNSFRTAHAFDRLKDSCDGLGRIISQARGRERVIVQRDGCVNALICHVVITGRLPGMQPRRQTLISTELTGRRAANSSRTTRGWPLAFSGCNGVDPPDRVSNIICDK
jgi:hypothetical protein